VESLPTLRCLCSRRRLRSRRRIKRLGVTSDLSGVAFDDLKGAAIVTVGRREPCAPCGVSWRELPWKALVCFVH
jgi:hypothetical protein